MRSNPCRVPLPAKVLFPPRLLAFDHIQGQAGHAWMYQRAGILRLDRFRLKSLTSFNALTLFQLRERPN